MTAKLLVTETTFLLQNVGGGKQALAITLTQEMSAPTILAQLTLPAPEIDLKVTIMLTVVAPEGVCMCDMHISHKVPCTLSSPGFHLLVQPDCAAQ